MIYKGDTSTDDGSNIRTVNESDETNNIENHNSQLSSNSEYINKYDDMIDICNDTQILDDVKCNISEVLDNIKGKISANGGNALTTAMKHEVTSDDDNDNTHGSINEENKIIDEQDASHNSQLSSNSEFINKYDDMLDICNDTQTLDDVKFNISEVLDNVKGKTSANRGNILTTAMKHEVTSDDDNDNTCGSINEENKMIDEQDASHKSQLSSNSECINKYDDMIDINNDTQMLDDVKSNISKVLDNGKGETSGNGGNILTTAMKREVTSDDDSNNTHGSINEENKMIDEQDASHKSQLSSNSECINKYDDMIDINNDTQMLDDVKSNISKVLDNGKSETSGNGGNILTTAMKREVTSDDDNDNTHGSINEENKMIDEQDASHNSQLSSNSEFINKYDDMLDICNDTQMLDVKFNISEVLDNVKGKTSANGGNILTTAMKHEVTNDNDNDNTHGSVNEENKMIVEQDASISAAKGNTLTTAMKHKVISDDDNDNTHGSENKNNKTNNIENHNSQLPECINKYDDMLDIENDTQSDSKCNIRKELDNVENAGPSKVEGDQSSSDEDIPLQILSSRKRLKLDVDNDSGPALKKRRPITSEPRRGNTAPPPALHHEGDTRQFSCTQCNYTTTIKKLFKAHKKTHTVEKLFLCDNCGYKTSRKDCISRHLMSQTCKKTLACHICDFKCNTNSILKRHLLIHLRLFACDKCDYKSNIKNNLKRHLMSHSGEKPFACNECDFETSCNSYLKRHLLRHNSEKPFACDKCDYKTGKKWDLKEHLSTHSREKPFACNQCDYRCSRKGYLKQHLRTHTGNMYACDKCDYKSIFKSQLGRHLLVHTKEKSFACDRCDFKCSGKFYLKIHLNNHTGEKPFACDKCDFKTTYKSYLKRHLRNHSEHRQERPKIFACDKCNVKFTRKTGLKLHLPIHFGIKTFACDKCDYKSIRKDHLKKHLMSHGSEKPFACDKCDYKVNLRDQLKRHIITKHREPLRCDKCDYKCMNKNNFKQHLLIHTQGFFFACDICDYKTSKKNNLRDHMSIHTAMFECDKCDYKTSRKYVLTRHLISHSVEKPFACDDCDFKAKSKNTLKQHILTHSGKTYSCNKCALKYINFTSFKRHLMTHRP